jgi:hypothetical protein
MLTCLSHILVFCWCNHLWRRGQLFFVHFLMSVSGLGGGITNHCCVYLFHFDQLPIGPIKIVCLQQEKWISGGKTFNILCLFCRSYELICAWKGWLYVSLCKLLVVFFFYIIDISVDFVIFETSSNCEESNAYHLTKYPFHPGVVYRPGGSCCSYVFMYMFCKINDESS